MERRRSTLQQNGSLTSYPTKLFCCVTHASRVYTKVSKNVDQTWTKRPAGFKVLLCCGRRGKGGMNGNTQDWGGAAADRLSVCLRTHWWLKWPPLFRGPNMHVPLVNSTLQLLHSELNFYGAARPHKELYLFMALYCLESNGALTSS